MPYKDAAKNRECKRRWSVKNPDKHKAAIQAWRARNQDRIKKNNAAWRARNKERILQTNETYRQQNRQKMQQASDRWRRQNPGKANARTARRKAAKLRATPAWVDYAEIAKFYIEAARKTAETGIPHEVDHFYPLQGRHSCGLHVPWNLRVITKQLNRSKKNIEPELEVAA